MAIRLKFVEKCSKLKIFYLYHKFLNNKLVEYVENVKTN